MSIETLLLLQQCLKGQQLTVGDPQFSELAAATVKALSELSEAIASVSDVY